EFGGKPGAGTIVRQLPVTHSGGVPAIVVDRASGASHLKVAAQTLEERREKKLSLLLEISKELSKQQELDRLLDKVVDFTFQLMGTDQQVLGILYVDNLTATHSFADEDLEFLIAFGSLAAVGIENSRRSERLQREALVLSNFQRYFSPNIAAVIAQQQDAGKL